MCVYIYTHAYTCRLEIRVEPQVRSKQREAVLLAFDGTMLQGEDGGVSLSSSVFPFGFGVPFYMVVSFLVSFLVSFFICWWVSLGFLWVCFGFALGFLLVSF